MFQVVLRYQYYVAHTIPQDCEMGIPASHWEVHTEVRQRVGRAWLEAHHLSAGTGQRHAAAHNGSRKEEISSAACRGLSMGSPGRRREFYEYFVERVRSYEFHHRPVKVLAPYPVGTDGLYGAMGCGDGAARRHAAGRGYYHRLNDSSSRRSSAGYAPGACTLAWI